MSISSVFMILSFLSGVSDSYGTLAPIDACVAKTIINKTNALFNHGIPYPMPIDSEYLLPAGVKICRFKRDSYMLKSYSKDDMGNLCKAICKD